MSPDAARFLEVHDNFYPDPDSVRSFALRCDYEKAFTGTWQGLQSLQRHPDTQTVFETLRSRLPFDGLSSWQHVESSFKFWGRPSAGMFAMLARGQTDNVHFHQRSGAWAGVCYLSHERDCSDREGVAFYRHKRTGITSIEGLTPEQRADLREDAFSPRAWEKLDFVPMVNNRMVLFDGRYLHAASPGFGTDAQSARLTQLFNLDILG